MDQLNWLSPIQQVGREIRIELHMSFAESQFAGIANRLGRPRTPLLPEERIEDRQRIERRKAENLLQSVRHGAVRR